jgi:phosphoribosylaminoimidazole-succinocarboxamide synthase
MQKLNKNQITQILIDFKPTNQSKISGGKSKSIYKTNNKEAFMMEFIPSLRSITYNRKENIEGTQLERLKALVRIYTYLETKGIETNLLYNKVLKLTTDNKTRHFIVVKDVNPIPIEWISRFYAAGSIVRLYPSIVKAGQKFNPPLQKYDLKQDLSVAGVDDPTLNENYMVGLNLITKEELEYSKNLLSTISNEVDSLLNQAGLTLIDMKMEFGYNKNNQIILIDEISQDGTRVNNKQGNSVSKDSFRQGKTKEQVLQSYLDFNNAIGATNELIEEINQGENNGS